jgi:uncharacterized protein YodC (DUF2158 family)
MNQKFKTGDIVQLKSGGPNMTVKDVGDATFGKPEYICQWFGGRKLEQGIFPQDSLELAKADAK